MTRPSNANSQAPAQDQPTTQASTQRGGSDDTGGPFDKIGGGLDAEHLLSTSGSPMEEAPSTLESLQGTELVGGGLDGSSIPSDLTGPVARSTQGDPDDTGGGPGKTGPGMDASALLQHPAKADPTGDTGGGGKSGGGLDGSALIHPKPAVDDTDD